MLGRLHPTSRDATIIGAGFSGLLAAYHLLSAGYKVTLHDVSPISGGLIGTVRKPWGIVETAAHSLRTNQATLDMCKALDVPLAYAKTKKKYIWRNGQPHRFPLSLSETLQMAWRAVTARATAQPKTLADWGAHHLGLAAVDNLLTPLASGIFGATPQDLMTDIALPRLAVPAGKTLLQHALGGFGQPKSSFKTRMAAPLGGMGHLTTALYAFVAGHANTKLHLGEPVIALPDSANVLVATPASAAGKLLQGIDAQLAGALQSLPYAALTSITACVRRDACIAPDGIGVLQAKGGSLNSLGILFNSSTFDGRVTDDAYVSFTLMMAGIDHTDEQLKTMVEADLQQVAVLQGGLHDWHITRWPQAIPHYGPALHRLLHTEWGWLQTPGHMLLGNYTGEVSLRGMIADAAQKLAQ